MRRMLPIVFAALALTSLGCQQETAVTCEPNLAVVETMPDFITKAVDATGPLTKWVKLRRLELNAVVFFYNPDRSFYITEQKHQISPWCNSIRILAREPQNHLIWELAGTEFVSYDPSQKDQLGTESFGSNVFTQAVLAITTAPVYLLGDSVELAKRSDPVKVDGLTYDVIEPVSLSQTNSCDQFVYYQNRQTGIIDMITLLDNRDQISLSVRGFDYKQVSENNIKIPTRIDIYRTDPKGSPQERLARISYYLKTE